MQKVAGAMDKKQRMGSDSKNLQKEANDGKLHMNGSADQYHVGQLQQGQQQLHMAVEEDNIVKKIRCDKSKICLCGYYQ